MSLKSIKNVLSKAEMKKIMAGSGSGNSYNYYCTATNSQGQQVSYNTTDKDLMNSWYGFWSRAASTANCVGVPIYYA